MSTTTQETQEWEADWWGDCSLTFGEEAKQLTYAHLMGLVNEPHYGKWPVYDLAGKSVVDIGGGPVSLLLKTRRGKNLTVVDPCPYPAWVKRRYEAAGIAQHEEPAETFVSPDRYSEAWCYNVLQHVVDPESVISTAKAHARVLRIFEWIETETNIGHPHTLHAADLDRWIGGTGTVGFVNENGAYGLAYWGCFDV
jgi:2-polyprenyl-3-methyl-5-hydroxy-6-metoxy-1,4-benzoquinol methylase